MSYVKNRLKVYGSVDDLLLFIDENYVKDIYHPSDGMYPSNKILFFGNLYPTPEDILNDKDKIYRWRMNNWGTPFLSETEGQINELVVLYKHDFDYTPYTISSEDGMFNSYIFCRLSDCNESFYKDNIHEDENELVSTFETTMTPPSKMMTNWINRYKYTTLVFRLDYWDKEDRFVGNIHYDYNNNRYILEHYIKEKDILTYVTYMLGGDIKTIEMYAEEIAELVLTVNKDKVNSTFEELTKMFIEEIESKSTFEEQVKFIASVINYLNNKECNS